MPHGGPRIPDEGPPTPLGGRNVETSGHGPEHLSKTLAGKVGMLMAAARLRGSSWTAPNIRWRFPES